MKIHILGPVGSGKTTLGRTLSKRSKCCHIELDNVMWERRKDGDRRRSESERVEYLIQTFQQYPSWIVEGVHLNDWMKGSLERADHIVWLEPPLAFRIYRVIRRYLRQLLGRESSNYRPSLRMLRDMIRWSFTYQNEERHRFHQELQAYEDKVYKLHSDKDVHHYISELRSPG
ncbi:ATP-binding cassette domain-containing protein [Halobacillus salinus]|uniref:ATP-binding cassette domain-containing protein n=1 Tax=Halobacillus salinus TaxID=192814 RepID=A0A4Z0H3L5_9BACI|nr:AAA family ATPase [Halobacillus salinus]TGB03856.1 ATP-binding cassette domain-containing protein [Halobacillus salinus]